MFGIKRHDPCSNTTSKGSIGYQRNVHMISWVPKFAQGCLSLKIYFLCNNSLLLEAVNFCDYAWFNPFTLSQTLIFFHFWQAITQMDEKLNVSITVGAVSLFLLSYRIVTTTVRIEMPHVPTATVLLVITHSQSTPLPDNRFYINPPNCYMLIGQFLSSMRVYRHMKHKANAINPPKVCQTFFYITVVLRRKVDIKLDFSPREVHRKSSAMNFKWLKNC